MKKIDDFIQEFSDNKGDKKKLKQVFEAFESVKTSTQPDPAFKARLSKRLEVLVGMKTTSTHIQKRQSHLFMGVFASFLFVGGAFYFMSDTLFNEPFSQQKKVIEAPKYKEDTGKIDTIIPQNNARTIVDQVIEKEALPQEQESQPWENEVLDSQENTSLDIQPEEDYSLDDGNQTPWIVEDVNTDFSQSDEPQQESDNSLKVNQEGDFSSQQIQWEEDASGVAEFNFDDAWADISGDSSIESSLVPAAMMAEPVSIENRDFKNYCEEVGWIYSNYPDWWEQCKKWDEVCFFTEYSETNQCFVTEDEIEVDADFEIFLDGLIDEIE